MIYLIFGDSITHGHWDSEGGWTNRLKNFLEQKTVRSNFKNYNSVYNLGIDGDTSAKLLARLEQEVKVRHGGEKTVFVFAIGVNDSIFFNSENRFKVQPEIFSENIRQIINVARKFSPKIIFMGIAPVDDSRVDPIPWLPEASYKNEYVKKYNFILRDVCGQEKVGLLDLFEELGEKEFAEKLTDGVHPDSKGHQQIFDIVQGFLHKNNYLS